MILRHPRYLSRGFTLIELLVVVSIIGILASIGFTGATAAFKAVHNAEANTMMSNLKIAMSAYQSDYSRLPTPADAGAEDYTISEEEDWKELVIMLQGNKDPFTLEKVEDLRFPNPRENNYISFKKKELTAEGALKDPTYGKKIGFYVMILDGDYDGIVHVLADPACPNISEDIPVNSSVAIYSRAGGTDEKPEKAISSW